MTPTEEDPVNRWATEHYGFTDADPGHHADHIVHGPGAATPTAATGLRRKTVTGQRHRVALLVSGVLGLALLAGVGGAALAADGGPDGRPDGRGGITQVDRGGRPDGFDGGRR